MRNERGTQLATSICGDACNTVAGNTLATRQACTATDTIIIAAAVKKNSTAVKLLCSR